MPYTHSSLLVGRQAQHENLTRMVSPEFTPRQGQYLAFIYA
jgi:hypothetical protein